MDAGLKRGDGCWVGKGGWMLGWNGGMDARLKGRDGCWVEKGGWMLG